ncbi:MAG: pyrimidine dimer DNA glycosylase/endonuclease V [Planctomycetota bacterium]
MRMWMVPPGVMCRSHLLGEHRELHALAGILRKGISIDGYLRNGLVDTAQIGTRHTALVNEITRRGYNHHSPLKVEVSVGRGTVDPKNSLEELRNRCGDCKERIDNAATDR